ncbi:hypothetical protein HPB47_006655 [Ixodes persulcatus]|uniref:Uncharacterized protein n=1 Tax=Ixodes persulcatus TaxID=34615 RepID=A0AC60P9R7_IXOPE|nr:hypothetical protein HPB47_006655 [Ixodes persulcatus]
MHKATLSSILRGTLPAIWETPAPLFLKPLTAAKWEEIRRSVARPAAPLCILGDEAFPSKLYLMRPFPGRGLDRRRKVFKYRPSRGRRTVENAFGILVSRWRTFLGPMHAA